MLNSNDLRNLKIAATTSKPDYDTVSFVERGTKGGEVKELLINLIVVAFANSHAFLSESPGPRW